jgi:hypothetical protein
MTRLAAPAWRTSVTCRTTRRSSSGTPLRCGSTPVYDRRNNVEMIVIPAGTLTSFAADVSVNTWGFGSHNQKFAMYVSNAY